MESAGRAAASPIFRSQARLEVASPRRSSHEIELVPLAPGSPSNLTANTVSSSEIDLTWTNPSGNVTDNHVYEFESDCVTPVDTVDLGSVETLYAATGLLASTTYCFEVTASLNGTEGPASATASAATDNPAPAAPTGLSGAPSSTSKITLSWTNPAGALTDNHVYEFHSDCATPITSFDLGTATDSYTVTGLSPSTTYCFEVSASTNGGEGALSSPESATTFNPAPAAPTALSATPASPAKITLGWTNPSGALTDNHVFEYQPGCSDLLETYNLGTVATTYTVGGLSASTTYCFQLTASTNGGEGPASGSATATTLNAVPGKPTGLSATALNTTAIYLVWTNPSGPLTDDEVYVYASDCSTQISVLNLGEVAINATVGGLSPSTTYCFQVAASTNGGEGPLSSAASATTLNPPPGPPTNLQASTVNTTEIEVSWTDPGGPLTDDHVYEYASDCTGYITYFNLRTVASTFNVTGLSPSTTYCFRVTASTNGGQGSHSNTALATTYNPAPGGPIDPIATAISTTEISLSWTNPTGVLTDDHVYEYAANCSTLIAALDLGGVVTSYLVSGLDPSTTYCFEETASTNGGQGAPSAPELATTLNPPPGAPTGLTASPSSSTSIFLSWVDPTGSLVDQHVYVYDPGCSTSILSFDLGAVLTSYNVTGLTASTTYCFRVTASTNGGEGAMSVPVSATTFNPAPFAPVALGATTESPSSILLAWSNPSGVLIDNHVYAFASDCTTPVSQWDLGTVATSYLATGLSPSTTYCFEVTASTNGGEGAPSTSTTATTFNPIPSAPSGLTATTLSTTSIDLTWTNPTGVLTVDRAYEYGPGCSVLIADVDLGGVVSSDTFSGLDVSTNYCFEVTASTNGGEGAPSAPANATTFNPAPGAPTGLQATPVNSTAIALSWTNPTGAITDEHIYEYLTGCAVLLTQYDLGGAATSATVPGLSPSTTYCFKVTASTNGGEGAKSLSASGTTLNLPPAAPQGLSATPVSISQIDLAWTNPSGSLTDDIVLEYASDCSTLLATFDLGAPGASFPATGLSPSTTYCFTVEASTNGGEGPASTPASATTYNAVPSAPTGLTATPASTTTISLTWTNPSGVLTDDHVFEYQAGCTSLVVEFDLGNVATSFLVSGLSPSTTYCFRTSASTNGGEGPLSVVASATTFNPVPGAPTGLTATPGSPSQITLGWTGPSGPLTDFQVYQYLTDCSTLTGSYDVGAVAVSYTVTGLTAGTTYCFKVAASTNGGEGPESAPVSGTTFNAPPGAPLDLAATATSTSTIGLSWSNPSGPVTDDHVYEFQVDCATPVATFDLGAAAISFPLTGLSPSTTYCFRVTASTNGGEGSASAASSATTFNPAPSAPLSLVGTPISTSVIALTWTNPAGSLTDNDVYEYQGGCTTLIASLDLGTDTTAYAVTGLSPSTTYCFKVTASTNGGEGPKSTSASSTTFNALPGAPAGLLATPLSPTQIELTWTNPSAPLTDLHVYEYRANCTTPITSIDLGTVATSYPLASLDPATTYCFEVSASTNGGEGAKSTPATATTLDPLPSGPTSLVATPISTSEVGVSWTNPPGALTDDHVYEYGSDCATLLATLDLGAVGSNLTVVGLSPSTTYCFRVTASTNGGEGGMSAAVRATTLVPVPSAPTGLSATAVSSSEIMLSWTNPSGTLSGLEVYVYEADCATPLSTIDLGPAATNYTAASLAAGTTYCFKVAASTASGQGALSKSAIATTLSSGTSAFGATSSVPLWALGLACLLTAILVALLFLAARGRRPTKRATRAPAPPPSAASTQECPSCHFENPASVTECERCALSLSTELPVDAETD